MVAGATGYDKGKQPAANDSDYFYKPLPRLARGHPKITVPADNEEIAVACSTKYETCTARPDSTATQKWCRDNCFHDPAFCPTDFCTPDCYEHIAIGDRKTSAEYQAGNRYPYTSDHDARDSGSTTSYSPADYYASLPSPVACASSSASFGKQSEPVRPHGTYRGHDATLYDQCTALPESTANQEWCQNNCFNDPPYCPTDFCASDCYKHIAPKDRMTRAEYKAAGLCPVLLVCGMHGVTATNAQCRRFPSCFQRGRLPVPSRASTGNPSSRTRTATKRKRATSAQPSPAHPSRCRFRQSRANSRRR